MRAMVLASALSAAPRDDPPAVAARELAAQRYAEVIHRMRWKVQARKNPAAMSGPTPGG